MKNKAFEKAEKVYKATPEYKAREKAWEAYEEAKKTAESIAYAYSDREE